MRGYRVELRIFGLLLFALFSTLILYFGLSEAQVTGDVLGMKVVVAGPAGFFLAQILIFFATDLFRFGLHDSVSKTLQRQIEKLTRAEIESDLDELGLIEKRLGRRRQRLEAALQAIDNNASDRAVFEAAGFRPVVRPGGPTGST